MRRGGVSGQRHGKRSAKPTDEGRNPTRAQSRSAAVLSCITGLFRYREVGRVTEVLKGEVITQDPWGESRRVPAVIKDEPVTRGIPAHLAWPSQEAAAGPPRSTPSLLRRTSSISVGAQSTSRGEPTWRRIGHARGARGGKLWLRSAPAKGHCRFFGGLASAVPEIQFSCP